MFKQKLKEIQQKYIDIFANIDCLDDFKKLMNRIESCIKILSDNKLDIHLKMFYYDKTKDIVTAFCDTYANYYNIQTETLESEIIKLLDDALNTYA